MIDLITGHQGVPHISAEQISAIQRAEIGISANNTVVRLSGGALSSVGLELTISEGYWRVHGYDMQFDEAEGVVFDPTEAGYSRIDQLYIEILQDISSGVQRAELIVIQGEPSTTTPTAPLAPTAPESSVDLLIEAVAVATITVSEGAMNMTDLTIAYEAVDSAELEEIRSSAQSAYDLAGEAKTDAESAQDTADSALGNANTALDMIESDDDAYKTNRGYEVGDKVIQNNKLYKCITPCTAGTWTVNESCFEETTITEELTSLNSSLTWTLIQEVTSINSRVTITDAMLAKYHEFYVYFDPKNTSGVVSKDTFLFATPILISPTSIITIRRTYWENASNRISLFVVYNTNKELYGYYNLNGTDITSGYDLKLYAR